MKHVLNRVVGTIRSILRLLGLSAIGALIVAGIVALRHMLETPQPLESLLPGEAHLYRWKHGHIFYKVAGKPERPGAPPMVLLHTPELAASGYEMRGIMPLLAAHYRVYALDLLGFGLSDRPDIDYSADLYTQLCQDFLAQVVKQPATILASGLSCNYAVAVAASTPNLCERLALISPVALFGDQPEETRLARILPAELLEAGPVKSLLYPLLVEITRLMTRSKNAPFDYTYATTHQFGAEHASMALLAGKLVRDVSREIEKVQQPTLIIWGAEDLERTRHIASQPDQHSTFWGAKQTQVALLQKAGRAVHEELPEVVAETLLQWKEPSSSAETENRTGNRASSVEAYCMKCKKKTAMLNAHEITMKNGRLAVQGVCAECGAQLFRMGRLVPGYPQTPV
jgi:pimeloyl-ACP methyl ester carboxylesterase